MLCMSQYVCKNLMHSSKLPISGATLALAKFSGPITLKRKYSKLRHQRERQSLIQRVPALHRDLELSSVSQEFTGRVPNTQPSVCQNISQVSVFYLLRHYMYVLEIGQWMWVNLVYWHPYSRLTSNQQTTTKFAGCMECKNSKLKSVLKEHSYLCL